LCWTSVTSDNGMQVGVLNGVLKPVVDNKVWEGD
jgi:hypothetical protein